MRDDHISQLRRTAGRLGGHRLRPGRHVTEPEAPFGIRRNAGEAALHDLAISSEPDPRTGERPALIVDHPPHESIGLYKRILIRFSSRMRASDFPA
jgi:hypothetical protein